MNVTRLPFNVEMLNALRDGRKGQTRRPVKIKPHWTLTSLELASSNHPNAKKQRPGVIVQHHGRHPMMQNHLVSAPCLPGEWVYVLEPYATLHRGTCEPIPYHDRAVREVRYQADERPEIAEACAHIRGYKWMRAEIMPRELSRFTLKTTGLRVEYLNDITASDAIAEGMDPNSPDPVADFRETWARIYGPRHWQLNPPVWVIDFEVLQGNIDQYLGHSEKSVHRISQFNN